MGRAQDTLCIGCGLPAGNPPRLNRLDDGRVCPTCRDRLLESLPPALPGLGRAAREEEALGPYDDSGYSGDVPS